MLICILGGIANTKLFIVQGEYTVEFLYNERDGKNTERQNKRWR
jgi:hypothetical protein